MSLTHHLPAEGVDVRRLTVEQPEARFIPNFEPNVEITSADWERCKQLLKWFKERNMWDNFASIAMRLYLMFPERREELGLTEEVWGEMLTTLANFRKPSDRHQFLRLASEMKILFPDRVKQLGLNQRKQRSMQAAIIRGLNLSFNTDSGAILGLKILWPEKFLIGEEFVSGIDSALGRELKDIRLIFPDHFNREIKDRISPGWWKRQRERLQECRAAGGIDETNSFVRVAFDSTISAAYEARVDNDGFIRINLYPPKTKLAAESKPVPAARSF